MTLNEYQQAARKTAEYPNLYEIVYPAMGLCGEAGEAMEKVKKAVRKGGLSYQIHLDKAGLVKEMGDVMWYLANLASDLKISLDEVAEQNLTKLRDRQERGVIKGEGDNR